MGDIEGAREILGEVLSDGTPAQQQAAREILATLG
jgi:FimV-like protein